MCDSCVCIINECNYVPIRCYLYYVTAFDYLKAPNSLKRRESHITRSGQCNLRKSASPRTHAF